MRVSPRSARRLVRNTATKSESDQRRNPAHRVSTYDCGVEVARDTDSVMRNVTLSSYRTREMLALRGWALKERKSRTQASVVGGATIDVDDDELTR